tara:strand:- start:1472 stop:2248 length:777 start_codon:yes stop_codon:yes gene_type:complete
MLGLGTTIANIDSGQVYKELSELANYADLDIHFDFSTLTGAHGDEVTAVTNLGASGSGKNINSNEGTPSLDLTTLSKACVAFDGTNDVLNMAASYTTTGKAHTFFMVIVKADTANDIVVSKAVDDADDLIKITGSNNVNLAIAYAGESAVTVGMISTGGGTASWSVPINVPVVMVVRRSAAGTVFLYAQDGTYVATKSGGGIDTGATFTVGAIGGTTTATTDWNGSIGEIGIYDANIGEAAAQELCKELSTKWGINPV